MRLLPPVSLYGSFTLKPTDVQPGSLFQGCGCDWAGLGEAGPGGTEKAAHEVAGITGTGGGA